MLLLHRLTFNARITASGQLALASDWHLLGTFRRAVFRPDTCLSSFGKVERKEGTRMANSGGKLRLGYSSSSPRNSVSTSSGRIRFSFSSSSAIIRLYTLLRFPADLAEIACSRVGQALLLLGCLHSARISRRCMSAMGVEIGQAANVPRRWKAGGSSVRRHVASRDISFRAYVRNWIASRPFP